MRGFSRKALKREYEDFNGEAPLPMENGDEITFDHDEGDFPEAINLKKRTSKTEDTFEPPEEDRVNLIGDTDKVSDASMAIRALLGEGGDFRAGSEIDDDQVRALLVLLDVAEELNSPRLLKTAENFLLLSISKAGTGRKQVVGAFKGLYEPNNQPGQGMDAPSGMLRGVR
jgi:hypothetical protein